MTRYIDADAFETFGYTSQDGTFDDGVQFVLEKIDEQPTADVVPMDFHNKVLEIEIKKQENLVEVVRCKDCKHSKMADYIPTKCPYYCKLMANCHSGDFFCSMGEGREDGEIY